MKKLCLALLLAFATGVNAQYFTKEEALQNGFEEKIQKAESIGKELINQLNEQNFEMIHEAFFGEALKESLSVKKLSLSWNNVSKDESISEVLEAKLKVTASNTFYLLGFATEEKKYDLSFTLNEEGLLTSLRFNPYQNMESWEAPNYVAEERFKTEALKIDGEKALLGEVTIPTKNKVFPLVVMVHGSGPNDMNASVGPNKLFKDLAYGLASRGIGSIRYNKRTFDWPNQILDNYAQASFRDVVDRDAIKALELAREYTEGPIILLGHSLGGYLAPRIAENQNVDAVIVMAGNSSPLEEVIVPQFKYLYENDTSGAVNEFLMNMIKTQVKNLKEGNYDSTTVAPILPLGLPAGFWIDLKAYDPVKMAQKQKIPYLVISGERDYQVPPKETKAWESALQHPYSKMVIYPKLNHMFFAGEGLCLPAEYEKKAHANKQVVADLVEWIIGLGQ